MDSEPDLSLIDSKWPMYPIYTIRVYQKTHYCMIDPPKYNKSAENHTTHGGHPGFQEIP